MGSLFGKRTPPAPTAPDGVPDDLFQQCLAHPEDQEVQRRIALYFEGGATGLLEFYRELARADERHLLPLARAYMFANKPSLAVVHYRKLLQTYPQPELREELAVCYEAMGKREMARHERSLK